MSETPFQPGMFNYAEIMEDFFTSNPENASEDERMQKTAFQGNIVQSGYDAMLASALAEQNSAIAQDNMRSQANLEKLNALDLMEAEFGYNELSKESNFQYENKFADAQYDRDIGMLAATGQQQRDNIRTQSDQDRLTTIVQGEQQRLTDAQNNASQEKIAEGRYASDNYQADVAADASKFGAEQSRFAAENVATTQAGAQRDVATTQAGASMYGARRTSEAQETVADTQRQSAKETTGIRSKADIKVAGIGADADKFAAQAAAGASTYGADRQLEGVKDTNKTSTRNIRTTGDETRTTMEKENRLKARDRADMSRYSRGLARAR